MYDYTNVCLLVAFLFNVGFTRADPDDVPNPIVNEQPNEVGSPVHHDTDPLKYLLSMAQNNTVLAGIVLCIFIVFVGCIICRCKGKKKGSRGYARQGLNESDYDTDGNLNDIEKYPLNYK
eukprot:52667_1